MNTELNSRALEIHESPVEAEVKAKEVSEEIYRLLLFTLLLSAISSILAIVVTIKSRHIASAEDKKNEQTEKDIKKELAELHKEIALLKGDL